MWSRKCEETHYEEYIFSQRRQEIVIIRSQNLAGLPPESDSFIILGEAIELQLQERNWKIRISDSSEAGWFTVKHYESNPVSLSEDDDKKIRAAKRQALRDQARQRKKRVPKSSISTFLLPLLKAVQREPAFLAILSRSLFLRQTMIPQRTVNSPEGLVDTVVPQATGGRSAQSVSQSSTSAAHLVSCQPVPQAPITLPENSFMASLQQEASGALGVQYSASHSGPKACDVNAHLEEEFADLLAQDKYCFDSESEQCISSRSFEKGGVSSYSL